MARNISPLRYPGGKSVFSGFLSDIILLNNLESKTYCEPFAGGAGAALNLLFDGIVSSIHINDADPALYAFWHSVLYDTENFLSLINNTEANLKNYEKYKEIYKKQETTILEIGFATFFLNRCNRSGIISSGGPIGGYNQNGNWKIDVRYNRTELIERISKIAQEQYRIVITNLDAIELFNSTKNRNYFYYIDPPYYLKGKKLYLNYYIEADHEYLANYLKEMDENWILTYDNSEYIKSLYKSSNQQEFSIKYSAQRKRKETEILIYPSGIYLPRTIRIGNYAMQLTNS